MTGTAASAEFPPAPADYIPLDMRMHYGALIGPLSHCIRDGQEWIGLRIEERHRNRGPMAHGGLVSSLADIVIGNAAVHTQSKPNGGCLSASLSIEFLAPAPVGCWLAGVASLDRVGGTLAFISCRLYADDQLAAQARSVLKFLKSRTPNTLPVSDA